MTKQNISRNDPCPCGSGAKYKRCCLAKDEVAGRQQTAPPSAAKARSGPELGAPRPTAVAVPPRESTPAERWWEAWIDSVVEAKGADARLDLARRALAEAPPPDGEFLYESFDPVLVDLERAGRHADRIALIEQIEARFPHAFQECAHYFAHTRFESALEVAGVDLVEEARRMGPHVAKVSDLFVPVPSRLAWQGSIAALRALTDAAWPAMRDSLDLLDWAVDEWAAVGIGAVILDHLERDSDLAPDHPSLRRDLALYETQRDGDAGGGRDAVAAYAQRWLRLLKPAADLPVESSVLERLGREEDEPSFEQATNLVAVLAARLRADRGWTRSQAWTLVRQLPALLRDCARRSGEEGTKGLGALLLPPAKRFVARMFGRSTNMFVRCTHEIEAVVLAVPAWAEAMAARGWTTEKRACAWQREVMGELAAAVRQVPPEQRDEPERRWLAFAMGEARERAG